MTSFFNHIIEHRKLYVIVYSLITLVSVFLGNSSLSFVVSEIPILLCLVYVASNSNHDKRYFVTMLVTSLVSNIILFACSVPGIIIFQLVLSVFCVYCTAKNNKIISLLVASVLVPGILLIAINNNENCDYLYAALLISFYATNLFFFSALVGEKISISFSVFLICLLCIASGNYRHYRFASLTLNEILSFSTYLEVADKYDIDLIGYFPKIIIPSVVLLIPFLSLKNVPHHLRKRVKFIGFAAASIVTFFFLSFHVKNILRSNNDVYFSYSDIFIQSFAEELEYRFYRADVENCREKLNAFETDISSDQMPNIVTVMCESYADIEDIYGFILSADPLSKYRSLSGNNIQKGYVICSAIGGGTSKSEFEYLTGIPSDSFTKYRNPFMSDIHSNTSFTADPLYDNYHKTFLHPYRAEGWNRPHVYKEFDYDEAVFIEDWGTVEEYYRTFVSDKSLYNRILDILSEKEEPQWIMAVTMQNHGGYDSKNEPSIRIEKDCNEDKSMFEDYFSCIKKSSDDMSSFVSSLSELPNEPTLFVFFGDHFPSDISRDNIDSSLCYETPYLIYSNYCELSDIPEYINMTQLFPFAKKAAGLPMSKWEKYLISLNGNNIDRDMAIARIRN